MNDELLIQQEERKLLWLQEAITCVISHYNRSQENLDTPNSGSCTHTTPDCGKNTHSTPDSGLHPSPFEESASLNFEQEHFHGSFFSNEPAADHQGPFHTSVIKVTTCIISENNKVKIKKILILITTTYHLFTTKIYDPGGGSQIVTKQ